MDTSSCALIVEDLDFWQRALSEVLTEAGFWIQVAPSYQAALDALAQHQFQLAVIDPVLDDANRRNRDGLRVLEHILDRWPSMSVVVVTSSDPDRIRREVHNMCPDLPLVWKEAWDNDQFRSLVNDLLGIKRISEL